MKLFVLIAAGLLPALASAQSPEAASFQASEGFRVLMAPGAFAQQLKPGAADFDRYLKEHLSVLGTDNSLSAAAATASQEVDLAALLNRHLKTKLAYTLGGKSVWVSGTFDRGQNAYASILEDGKEARFFNVKGLLDKEEQLQIGSAKYKLYLSPNVFNQMKSEIVLENAANEDDKVRITLKKLLDSVGAAGDEVKLGDQTYRTFYFDNIKDGKIDKTLKTLAFIFTEASGELHVFLVPSELVPADKVATFKLFQDRKMGLQQVAGKLKVYENP